MTAFCTGSICRSQTEVRGQHAAQDRLNSDDRLMLTEWHFSLSQSVCAAGSYDTLSYRVEVREKSNWWCCLDRKWQEWFHHRWGTSGAYEPWQRPTHCATPTSWKQRDREFEWSNYEIWLIWRNSLLEGSSLKVIGSPFNVKLSKWRPFKMAQHIATLSKFQNVNATGRTTI